MDVRDERPPAWIADDAEVARRVVRRRYDVLRGEVWWGVAETVRWCRSLTAPTDASPVTRLSLVICALREAAEVAYLLPPPLPLQGSGPPTWEEPVEDLLLWGPRRDVIDTLAVALCAELDDAEWTCPDRLAGLVEDLRQALRAYRRGLFSMLGTAPTTFVA